MKIEFGIQISCLFHSAANVKFLLVQSYLEHLAKITKDFDFLSDIIIAALREIFIKLI